MNDTAPTSSLATRARQLTALARVKRDSLDEAQTRGQVQTALNRLDQGLVSLGSTLSIQRKLKDVGVAVDSPVDLEQSARRLQEQAELGRPSSQFLQVRFRDVDAARVAIDTANAGAWRIWSSQIVDGLPVALLPRVHFSRRDATKRRISAMGALSAKKPNIPDIIQFLQDLDRVKDEFIEVGGSGIDSLLNRFEDGQILLADLSDEELQILRGDASLADQLYVRIRP